jgi:hypothetical protein
LFLNFYRIGQAKPRLSSHKLSRHSGVNYDTACLLNNKIMRAMSERKEAYVLPPDLFYWLRDEPARTNRREHERQVL